MDEVGVENHVPKSATRRVATQDPTESRAEKQINKAKQK
jgi:hypothetical protein